jgi:hypothetical protein
MILYGGSGDSSPFALWSLDLAANHWTGFNPAGGPTPAPTSMHAAVYDDRGDRMLVYSGQGQTDNLWQMSFPGNGWQQLFPSGGSPGGRFGCAAVYDTAADAMLLFGGEWSGSGYANDSWILLLRGTPTWQSLSTPGSLPRQRGHAAFAYDQVGARLVVFSGSEYDGNLSDTWVLSFDRATPVQGAIVRATARVDRIELTWSLPGSASSVRIERRDARSEWRSIAERNVDGTGRLEFVDFAVVAGARYGYRVVDRSGEVIVREQWIDVPSAARIELSGFTPNPARGDVRLAFTLANAAPARIEVIDLAGRRVFARDVGSLGAGRHVLPIGDSRLASGVYVVRLAAAGHDEITRRAVLLR